MTRPAGKNTEPRDTSATALFAEKNVVLVILSLQNYLNTHDVLLCQVAEKNIFRQSGVEMIAEQEQ